MKWIEMIKVRTAGQVQESLKVLLSGLLKNGPSGLAEARLYRHASWETDWTLQLYWDSTQFEENGTALGLCLAQTLTEFGLVDHSIWIEESWGFS